MSNKKNPDPDPRPAPACPAVVIRNAIRRGSSRREPPPSLRSRPTAHHQLSSTHPEPAFGGAPFDPPTSHMPAPTGQLISALHCERLPSATARPKGTERSEEQTTELQSLMRTAYGVLC